ENPTAAYNANTNPYMAIGEPVVNWSGNAFASNPTGFTISANGLEMVLSGNLAFTAYDSSGWKISDFNLGMISGNLTSSYVYDTTTTGEPLVAYADNLNIDWTDLSSFMVAQPDMGPPPVMVGAGNNAQLYEIPDGDHNSDGAKTKVDSVLIGMLQTAGFAGTLEDGVTEITEQMLQALAPAPVYNLYGMDYAVANHPSGASSTVDYDLYLKFAELGAPAGIALADGAAITQAAVDWLITNDVPPVLTLAQMMGGANALTAISDSLATEGTLMGMGAEERYDPMGNLIRVMDDGYGNLTEFMTDPLNANIEIKTEYLAGGEVRVTQLITDTITKVVQEVSMGSGSRVENDFYDEIITNVGGREVTEREYDMANVFTKIERSDDGAYTEEAKDARGVKTEAVAANDGSLTERVTSADGQTVLERDFDANGVGTVTKTVTPAGGGTPTKVEVGTITSTTVNGVRTDITDNLVAVITAGVGTNPSTISYVPDGTFSKAEFLPDGTEILTSYNSQGVEVSSSTRIVLESGASVHTNVVNGLEVVVTYTTQADASLKAVYKTASGTTLKEELTTYDAAGAPTVTAKEFLGVDHTRVTVSDAETPTTVTTEASGAVTKAVKDIAADKTVTTMVDAAKAVTVTEQVGTAAAVTTATGTLTVRSDGEQFLDLNLAGGGTEQVTILANGLEFTVLKDENGVQTNYEEVQEDNSGTLYSYVSSGNTVTEKYTKANGETETVTVNQTTGALTVTQELFSNDVLVESTLGTGFETRNSDNDTVWTFTYALAGPNGEVLTEERVWVGGDSMLEITTFKTDGVITKVMREEADTNGNNIILEKSYDGLGAVTSTVETVVGVDGTVQEKEVSATGEITLKESGIDGLGNAFEKVLGTGTSETVNGVTTDTITLSDKSTVTEKFDGSGALTEKVVADQAGDKKISTFDSSGTEAIAYADASGQAIEASEVDIKLDIGFANNDLGFVNVDYTDMASGFTSQAGDFNLAVDYSNAELATSDGGYASGNYTDTGGNNTGGNNTGGNNTGGNNTGGNNTGGNNTGGNNNVNVADYTDYGSFYGDGSNSGGYDYAYDIY
ncbi:hypothetical protein N9J94_06755, partial [Planktomarina sp.]